MNKLTPIQIDGCKLIPLDQLTIDQANDLRSWLPKEDILQIHFQGFLFNECIAYDTYVYWFKTHQVLSRTYESILDF
ncbi:hypothetical protein [Cecembia rubra]|uniref:hypothetical protein n=1 Tax=Cecembia rubra TaxID=1485585 RepID=UPI002714B018|nr:hypothetical protein [Cecembia rubra]